jgi:PAS domain S-box-containing protein
MMAAELAELFKILNIGVLERAEDGFFRLIGSAPEWLFEFYPDVCLGQAGFRPGEGCPFLENFLIDAEAFWRTQSAGRLKSGLWIAEVPAGAEHALEATAVAVADRKLLLLESCWVAYRERQKTIQTGRELSLDHHRLLRLETALRKSQSELERKVEERTAELTRINALLQQEIAQHKKAEEGLIQLATAIEQAADAVFITDKAGIIQYVNPAFERTTGYGRQEMIGQDSRALRIDKPDDAGGARMWDTILQGEVWRGKLVGIIKDGTARELETVISPIRDSSGTITSYVSVSRDLTQEAKLEKQLRQAQKMEAIGTLAGGIAHDFNNILTAILGYAEIARFDAPPEGRMRRSLDQVLQAANRARDLVAQILSFSRQSEQEKKPIELVLIVKEVLKLLRASLPTTIEIRSDLDAPLNGGVILGDPTQIHQVLMNLGTNAADAMREHGGVIDVSLDEVEIDEHTAAFSPDLNQGPYLRLTVSDTGHGMDRSVLERIFDPFFTTKGQGRGTGLGLAVVHGIVKSHGGAIRVYSEVGQGTTFRLFLPGIRGQAAPQSIALAELPTGNERILFVDDEKSLAELGEQILEHLGYRVTARSNSIEALETFRAQPDEFDLVITDQTMPNLTGMELAREILLIRPAVPIILCTGFSELITREGANAIGVRAVVMKPPVIGELAQAVRKLLDES